MSCEERVPLTDNGGSSERASLSGQCTFFLVIYVLGDTGVQVPGRIDEIEERDEELQSLRYSSRFTALTPTSERELARSFSIYRAVQRRLEMDALRGGPAIDVSDYVNDYYIPIVRPADVLLNLSTAAQNHPDKVARNIRRTERLLSEARGDLNVRKKTFSTAYVNRRVNDIPRTVFGTEAWVRPFAEGRYASFATRGIALPCLERTTRRQVLFAKNKARKGYRVKHRINALSHIWC